jgi:hypothetical protein
MTGGEWCPPEMEERFIALVETGISARAIAAEFGLPAKSGRNMVIGKAHRLGLRIGKTPESVCEERWAAVSNLHGTMSNHRLAKLAGINQESIPRVMRRIEEKKKAALQKRGDEAIIHVRNDQCLWPFSDPDKPDFRFCDGTRTFVQRGRQYLPGPYCAEHLALAYGKADE